MRTVTEVKKLKSGYRVFFDHQDEPINIELDIYFKYHLKLGSSLDEKTFLKMKAENDELYYMRLGILRLKKMQTEQELAYYLMDKACPKPLVSHLMSFYKTRNYINDEEYTKNYIELKKYQQGPQLLKSELLKKGVDLEIIDQYIKTLNQEDILEKNIAKRLSTYKSKSKRQALNTTKTYFLTKGFYSEDVDRILNSQIEKIDFNDASLLSKTFDQYYQKYKSKKSGYALKALLKQKLYQKGFDLNDIENIFIDKDVLS